MMEYPKNFPQREFACKCGCGFDAINPVIPRACQEIRDYINIASGIENPNIPIIVTSGCRCDKRNKEAGSKSMNHVHGNAADIKLGGNSPNGHILLWHMIKDLYDLLVVNRVQLEHSDVLKLNLVLLEGSWVHIDVDRARSRVFQKL